MLDFSRLQRVEIPEGKVTKITDASGRVLWKYQPQITVSGQPIIPGLSCAYISVPNGEFQTSFIQTTYSVPVGTIIRCHVGADTGYEGKVVLNGEVVYTKTGEFGIISPPLGTYDYEVTRDARIVINITGTSSEQNRAGQIIITEE